jgi:peptide/nickel transport system permease protein
MTATAPVDSAVVSAVPATPPGTLHALLRNKRIWTGLVITTPVVFVAIFGPYLAPRSPLRFVAAPYASGTPTVFGADYLGRDVLSQFLAGGRTLLVLAALSTLIGVAGGALLGILTAYVRGRFDSILMRAAEVALAFPPVVLALMFLSLLGPKLWLIVVVVAIGHLPRSMRVIRAAALSVTERDFITYGKSIGAPRWHMISREILPNVTGPLMVELGVRLTYSVGLVAGLDFLGLGVQPPTPDWGVMINQNRGGLTFQPWGVLLPLIALALLAVGCNIITDGIARVIGSIDSAEPS